MIQLPTHIQPPQNILDKLAEYQAEITGTFAQKQALVKAKTIPGFSSRNKKGNLVFDAVKASLTQMCAGAKRCAYCEDAPADEVEHIYPKDLYPNKCFDWHNYLYACGTCNSPKSNQFAIFRADDGSFLALNGENEPPNGVSVLINPRIENAMNFCRLNFLTFHFEIIAEKNSHEYLRADYTFNTVLRLNTQREYLLQARKNAYSMYKARLGYFISQKDHAPQSQLAKMVEGLKKEAHLTVWKEIQKSYHENRLLQIDKDFYDLFQQFPEALNW